MKKIKETKITIRDNKIQDQPHLINNTYESLIKQIIEKDHKNYGNE